MTVFLKALRNHFQGRAEFLPMILVNILGLSAITIFLINLLAAPAVWLLMVLLLAFFFWQVVGTARAGAKLLGQSSGLFQSLLLGATQLAVFIYAATSLAGAISEHNLDPNLDRFVPPEQRVHVAEQMLIVTGQIDYTLLAQFDAALTAEISTVQLTSEGGNIFAARAMAQRIETANLSTIAAEECFSACTLVFLAGANRQLATGARLGFHAYAKPDKPDAAQLNTRTEQQTDMDYLVKRGVTKSFALKAFATDHSRIWLPTPAELRAAGVLTR